MAGKHAHASSSHHGHGAHGHGNDAGHDDNHGDGGKHHAPPTWRGGMLILACIAGVCFLGAGGYVTFKLVSAPNQPRNQAYEPAAGYVILRCISISMTCHPCL